MKYLFLLKQTSNGNYDTYDSCVVCAESFEDARKISPKGYSEFDISYKYPTHEPWTSPDKVDVTKIGTADPLMESGTIICASFNAG